MKFKDNSVALQGSDIKQQVSTFFNVTVNGEKPVKPKPSTYIVYTVLGHSFGYQAYVWDSIQQARYFNPETPIVILTSKAAMNNSEVASKAKQFNVATETYDTYLDDPLYQEFKRVFFIQGQQVPVDGNPDFVFQTTARLYVVHSWMNRTSRLVGNMDLNVVHLENDNLLYVNVEEIRQTMYQCNVRMAYPITNMKNAVLGIVYIRDQAVLQESLEFNNRIYSMGREKAMGYIGDMLNDCSIYSKYLEYAQEVQSYRQIGVYELSDRFYDAPGQNCVWDKSQIIYDPNTLAQWYGGSHEDPQAHIYQKGRLMDPRNETLTWCNTTSGWKAPYVGSRRVGSFHMHSKQLKRWFSTRND